MKLNYGVFGDVMSFDATFRTNRYDLVFVPFTGIDNHHHNVTFVVDKVGTNLSHDEDFKEKICNVVWTDALEPAEFEKQWFDVMLEYNIHSHKWLSDMSIFLAPMSC
ncbi:hypothetical protein L1987_48110 [Smallanthus sonchifolius]|uniref:Uncharacterized protein n=1 Tax=Smallanthus sonchifolius TaxID=185202 RepID=A0ACB9FR32_9ASTR|nr:hypothetical protein L1987_48110 [Smallanthus sonchifolius]